VQQFAQPPQRRADGGLRLPQAQRGLRDAALGQQRLQHADQPDVQGIRG